MNNLQIDIKLEDSDKNNEIIISELAQIGFDSFWESNSGLSAYVSEANFDLDKFKQVIDKYDFVNEYTKNNVLEVNWNAKWEANYEAINVENDCLIRSPFHPEDPTFLHEIIIMPQMSFGTGHHDTTYLMTKHLLKENLLDKALLDMGCGTGVLAILAEKIGAKPIWAIDIDDWAYKNTLSNCLLNAAEHVSVKHGDASGIPNRPFDYILANINKNILINDIKKYTKHLSNNGILFLSGFFEIDVPEMEKELQKNSLRVDFVDVKNEWAFIKCTLKN